MAYLQVPQDKRYGLGRLIFAFPGMGKTPYAHTHAGTVDADFGWFRTAMNVDKENEGVLLRPWSDMIRSWLLAGYTVLSNDPKLFRYFRNYPKVEVYLPLNPTYSAKKMKQSADTIDEWTHGWADDARKYGLKTVWIDVGLDKYLS